MNAATITPSDELELMCQANAKLIAAAPELLRSLHYIAERLQHGGRAAKSDCLTQCQWAITKATGGADQ
jgi:hypothetical protein